MKLCPHCNTQKEENSFKKGRFSICKPCYNKKQTVYREKNRDVVLWRTKEWKGKNVEKVKQDLHAWKKENPTKVKMYVKSYRAHKGKAAPAWRNTFYIEEIYNLAKKRSEILGEVYHVDHIIPLQGANVCGLHVENNLQIVSAKYNLKKGNKFNGEKHD